MRLHPYPLFLLVLLLAAGCGEDTPTGNEPSVDLIYIQTESASFVTSDGFTLNGTWYTPGGQQGSHPVVILLHMFNQNRNQWDSFIPDLVTENSYTVLAFDLRGHGLSTVRNGQSVPLGAFADEDIEQMPLDVEAAVAWIQTRPEADAARIGLIGTEIGANIAFVSSGTIPEIKATVSVSPEYRQEPGPPVLIGENIPDFRPHTVLYLAAFGDGYAYTSSETMAELTHGAKRVIGFQGTGRGFILLIDEEAWAETLKWLRENL